MISFYFTTWLDDVELVSFIITSKASIVLYDGSPFTPNYEHLFKISEKEKITFFGTGTNI